MNYIQDITQTSNGWEGQVYCGVYDKFIGLLVHEGANVEFANACAGLLNELPDPVIDHLCRASVRYCTEFLSQVGEPAMKFDSMRSVLDRIDPRFLIVPAPDEAGKPVVHMELNCDWDEEHGLEWLIRDGAVLYVGGYTGCQEYGSFERRDPWNYAWQTTGAG